MANKFRGRFTIQGNRKPINLPEFLTANLPNPVRNPWRIAIATDGGEGGAATTVISDGAQWIAMSAGGGGGSLNGARLEISPDIEAPDAVDTIVPWTTEVTDLGGWADLGADDTIFTVPADVNYVVVEVYGAFVTDEGPNTVVSVKIEHNDGGGFQDATHGDKNSLNSTASSRRNDVYATTGLLPVAEGDTLRAVVYQNSGSGIAFGQSPVYFTIYALG